MRKKYFTLLSLLLLALIFSCDSIKDEYSEKDVPEGVLNNFYTLYPSATEKKYQQKGNLIGIDFIQENVPFSALYNRNGDWLETDEIIQQKELPPSIFDSLAVEFPKGFLFEKFARRWYPDRPMEYFIGLSQDSLIFECGYSPEGHLMRKRKKPRNNQ